MTDPRGPEGAGEELVQLLERRAQRVRAPPQPLDDESALWVAEFPVGEERYAIPLEQLRAAVPLRAVTPVPLSPPHVIGVLRFQGQIISALSLASLLGGSGWKEDPGVLLVIDPGMGRLCALDCEQIPKPASIPHALIEAARSPGRSAVAAIAMPGQRPLHLIDVRLLMDRRREARDAR